MCSNSRCQLFVHRQLRLFFSILRIIHNMHGTFFLIDKMFVFFSLKNKRAKPMRIDIQIPLHINGIGCKGKKSLTKLHSIKARYTWRILLSHKQWIPPSLSETNTHTPSLSLSLTHIDKHTRTNSLSITHKRTLTHTYFPLPPLPTYNIKRTHIHTQSHTHTHTHTIRGHSNNTWHYFVTFLTTPHPPCDIFLFSITFF